jgi:hypothetical protein
MSQMADAGRGFASSLYRPGETDVLALIRRAAGHELGTRFLLEGAQDAVAAVFQVHAFLVDAARDYLQKRRRPD